MTAVIINPVELLAAEVEEISTIEALLTRQVISFGSLPPPPFAALIREKLALQELLIQTWIGEEGERSGQLVQYQQSHAALHAAAVAMQRVVDTLSTGDPQRIIEHTSKLIEHREQSLLVEAQLQLYEGTLSAADLALIRQGLAMLDPSAITVRVDELCVEVANTAHAFDGVLLFTTQRGIDTADGNNAVLLFMPGAGGGLQKFADLQALKDDVLFTLLSGLDTPFWRHIKASSRAELMDAANSGSLQLTARVITGPAIAHSLQTQVDSLTADARAAIAGQRVFDDAPDAVATLERLHLEWADNLQVHRNEARDQAIEAIVEQQRTVSLVAQVPNWLLNAPQMIREEYAQQLSNYHAAAFLLEKQLDSALLSFEAFSAQRLAARIKEDLNLDIDADQVFIDLPATAARELDIDPQYGSLRQGKWIASVERVRLSLAELARHNIDSKDDEMRGRLSFARLDSPAIDIETSTGLNVDYVTRIIPLLDIAGQYRVVLRDVFQADSEQTPVINRDVLLEPYGLEVLLEGYAGLHSKRLSTHGYQVLQWAVHARSNTDLRDHNLQMSWVVLNPGHAVNGDRNSATLSGLCVIHHEPTATTLVYLPQAPDGFSIIEAQGLAAAKERLINRLNAHPSLVDYLASRADDENRYESDKAYIHASLLRNFDGFVSFTPAIFLQVAVQQVDARAYLLYAKTKREARSNGDIHSERELRKDLTYRAYFRALLSFLPGLGTLISLQDGWHDGHAAVSAFNGNKKEEGELLIASTSFCVLDILLSVVPGLASLAVVAKIARRTTKLRQIANAFKKLPSSTRKHYVLPAFKGYEADVSLLDARRQQGIDAGTLFKDGELWIKRNDQAYKVYRRKGEQTLRLRKVAGKGYEPPVRLNAEGIWVYHTDVGLKGGVKSDIAEILITKAHLEANFTRKQARELLDQYEFPVDQQRRLELDLALHYQSHRSMPDWAEVHRRQPKAQPEFAMPAPAKRKQPPVPASETDRQPLQPVPGPSRPSVPSPQDNWKSWGRTVDQSADLERINVQPPIFRMPGKPDGEMIVVDGKWFEVLSAGATQNPTIVFLKNPAAGTSKGSFAELNETIRVSRFDQPVMASFTAEKWTIHGTLFSKKIQHLIADVLPSVTPISQRVLAEKLYLQADEGVFLTATRLMNMKATINAWRKGHPAPLPQLNDPLTMLNGATPANLGTNHQIINISYESSLNSFFRLDFQTGDVLDIGRLRRVGPDVMSAQEVADIMVRQLTSSGYELLPDGNLKHFSPILIFRRPGIDQLYMMSVRRVHFSKIVWEPVAATSAFPLSNTWMDNFLVRYAGTANAAMITDARAQGKLVRLVGGANITRVSGHNTQLFVIRIADDI